LNGVYHYDNEIKQNGNITTSTLLKPVTTTTISTIVNGDSNGDLKNEPLYSNYSNNSDSNNGRTFINWPGVINKEHQTYAGYLKKQGALFKQWKERYFVLDSVKHQVCLN
jgi:hypothetical protein